MKISCIYHDISVCDPGYSVVVTYNRIWGQSIPSGNYLWLIIIGHAPASYSFLQDYAIDKLCYEKFEQIYDIYCILFECPVSVGPLYIV